MTNLWTPPSLTDIAANNAATSTQAVMRTVLVCDVVESMLWMQQNETAAVAQWQAFVAEVKRTVLPRYGARLVKSLGDGLMLEFDQITSPAATPRAAVQAAHALHQLARGLQGATPLASIPSPALTPASFHPFNLRIGLHHTAVTVGEDDIYGHGVNLCARIAGLAGPGETIISSDMRDQLTDQLDADIEDMGECYLKHVDEPVRVYRAGKASHQPILVPEREYNTPLQATIAVIPFVARSLAADNQLAVGDIIADGVIGQLSRTRDLKVISRLSTSVFRNQILSGGANNVAQIEGQLGANYILSGSYIALDKKLIVTAELAQTKTNQVVWMDRIAGDVGDILQLQSELCNTIANATHVAILDTEVQAALTQPLPTLESYSMLLAGISMMHRASGRDFTKCKEVFEEVCVRHSTSSTIHTWLAKWHVFNTVSGFGGKTQDLAKHALSHANRALQSDPNSALALATQGFVLCQMMGDKERSGELIEQAIKINPNESLSHLYHSVWFHMWDDPKQAIIQAKLALRLSPIDPSLYFFETILSNAHIANDEFELAIEAARRSIKTNRMHMPTWRVLFLAQVESNLFSEARETYSTILKYTPDFTLAKYESMGSSQSKARQRMICAMKKMNLT